MKFLIVDDHPLFREALKGALAGGFKGARITPAGSFEQAIAELERDSDLDLVLLDLKMPGVQGLSGLIYLRTQYPGLPVIIVSASEDHETMRRSLDHGVSGYIPKSTPIETIIAAIKTVIGGDVWMPADYAPQTAAPTETDEIARRIATLSAQQIRVLMMLRAGLLNKQIAYELGVSESTIKSHVSAILLKLKVASRTQAVIAASKIEGLAAAQ